VLYVGNWDPKKRVIMRYRRPDGTLGTGGVARPRGVSGLGGVDGLGRSRRNVYAAAPGGV
jgi:hypothetical protein